MMRTGEMSDTAIKALLIIFFMVIIILGFLAFSGGKIPRTMKDVNHILNQTLDVWDTLSGTKEKKLLQQQQEIFMQNFRSLEEAYRSCMLSKNVYCLCPIPGKEGPSNKQYYVELEQMQDDFFVIRPLMLAEENLPVFLDAPAQLPGEICLVQRLQDDPHASSGLPIELREDAELYKTPFVGEKAIFTRLKLNVSHQPLPQSTLSGKGRLTAFDFLIKRLSPPDLDVGKNGLLFFDRALYKEDQQVCFISSGSAGWKNKPLCTHGSGACIITDSYWSLDGRNPLPRDQIDFTSRTNSYVFATAKIRGCEGKQGALQIFENEHEIRTLEGTIHQGELAGRFLLPSVTYNAAYTFRAIPDYPFVFGRQQLDTFASGASLIVNRNTCVLRDIYWSDAQGKKLDDLRACLGTPQQNGPYHLTIVGEQCNGIKATIAVGRLAGQAGYYRLPKGPISFTFAGNAMTIPYTFDPENLVDDQKYYAETIADIYGSGKPTLPSRRYPQSPQYLFIEDDRTLVADYC